VLNFDLDTVLRLLREFQTWSPPTLTFYVVTVLSLVTTAVIARLLSGSQIVVYAGSYIVLVFFGFVANFLFRLIAMTGTTDMQKAIVATIAGQMIAVIVLLMIFKRGDVR
jgi:ABC-type Na+ efflux pump permease subunit